MKTLHIKPCLRPILALNLLVLLALFGNPVLAQEGTAKAPDGGQPGAGGKEIRLGMSADFSASARGLSIELHRGAMAYLTPLDNAGGVNGRAVTITAYDDKYQRDLAMCGGLGNCP